MFERLKRLYEEGRVSAKGLSIAVKKEWITEEQKVVIIGE